jgi:hypothetical protein
MTSVKTNAALRFLFFVLLFAGSTNLFGQATQTKRPNVSINTNCNGFLEYLPSGYSSGSERYSLMIFFMGINSTGPGTDASLDKFFNTGGGFIQDQVVKGEFPESFTVNGQTHKFIIITPQFITDFNTRLPTPKEVDDVINYAVTHYRVDPSRIYLTGNSSGGGPVWDYVGASSAYANKIAAIVPFCGVSFPTQTKANVIRNAGIGVWAFHNQFDSGVPVSFTNDYISFINNPSPAPKQAKKTIFPNSGHDCWYQAYMRNYTEEGLNIYQWMLQFQRPLTKANAGNDVEFDLPTNSVQLQGSGTGPNGSTSSYNWTKVSGPSGGSFSSSSVANPTVSSLTAGTYIFRLSITDNAGGVATDDVAINVNAQPIRVEAESFTAMSGVVIETTGDVGGGQNVGYIDNGDWMDYSVNVPAAGSYTVRFRVASFMAGARFQLKNSSGSVLSDVEVYNTGGWQTYMTLYKTITLPAGQQTLRIVSSASAGWNFNWFELVSLGGSSTPVNQAPTAAAGTDKSITLPTNSTELKGTGTDPDGSITGYGWTQISGPSTATINPATSQNTTVSNLSAGTYVFRLTVTDNNGATGTDDIAVTVNSAPSSSNKIEAEAYTAQSGTQLENANDVGGTQNVGYIDNGDWMDYSITPSAAGSYTFSFRIASHHTGGRLQVRNSAGTALTTVDVPNTGGWQTWQTITGTATLAAGTQTIRIASVASGNWNINWFQFDPATSNPNIAPTANAGTDITITLPTSSASLSGTGSDADGSITGYGWTFISGPSTPSISSPAAQNTTVSNLVAGTYVFRLTVTDNNGATGTDDVVVTVNSSTPPPSGSVRIQAEAYSSQSGTQLENTQDVDGAQNVGYIDNGDWMDYSINPSTSTSYTFSFRIATQHTGAQFQVRSQGGATLATINVPNTGGWQTWQTITGTATLAAGQQTIRLVSMNSNSWNINWFEFAASGTPSNVAPTAHAGTDKTLTLPTNSAGLNGTGTDSDGSITGYAWSQLTGPSSATINPANAQNTTVSNLVAGTYVFRLTVTDNNGATGTDDVSVTVNGSSSTTTRIEAEAYSAQSGTQIEGANDTGGGQNVGYIDNGDWMDYSVTTSAAGTYTMNFRIATQHSGAQFQVRNAGGSVLATVSVPNTGGWQTWQTISASVPLASGTQTIRLVSVQSANWNINWLELAASSGSSMMVAMPVDRTTESAATTLGIYPNPVRESFVLHMDGATSGRVQVQVFGLNGNLLKQYSLSKARGASQATLNVSGLAKGEYILVVQTAEGRQSRKLVKL